MNGSVICRCAVFENGLLLTRWRDTRQDDGVERTICASDRLAAHMRSPVPFSTSPDARRTARRAMLEQAAVGIARHYQAKISGTNDERGYRLKLRIPTKSDDLVSECMGGEGRAAGSGSVHQALIPRRCAMCTNWGNESAFITSVSSRLGRA